MEIEITKWTEEETAQIPDGTLLLNVETTGLRPASSFIYMIAAGYRDQGALRVTCMLAENRREEPLLLDRLRDLSAPFDTICCFGGNAFAFRFLRQRWEVYREDSPFPGKTCLDLQKTYRPLQRILPVSGLKRAGLEAFLGFSRADRHSGKDLIPLYGSWERSRMTEARQILLTHAVDDIRSLCAIARLSSYLDFLSGHFTFLSLEEENSEVIFSLALWQPVPVELVYESQYARIRLQDGLARIQIPAASDKLRYFLPGPCSDYYYLPAEDTAVHKSVARFVDKSQRVKASPQTCYVCREGIFLPAPDDLSLPLFYKEYKSSPAYIEFDKEKWLQDPSLIETYLAAIL